MNLKHILLFSLLHNNLVSSQAQNISRQVQPKLDDIESTIMKLIDTLTPEKAQKVTMRVLDDLARTKAEIQLKIQGSQQQLQELQKELEHVLRREEFFTNLAKKYNAVEDSIDKQDMSIISGHAISPEKLNEQERIMREYERKNSWYTRDL